MPDEILDLAREHGATVWSTNGSIQFTPDQLRAFVEAIREKDAQKVPTSWLDPILTGPRAVIGRPPYVCADIERVLSAVAAAIRTKASTEGGGK